MTELKTNVLYYGDNLEILRKYIPDSSVDLIYLDPPFNSKATYNVLYKEPTGKPSQAQISAFEDTWQWGLESERSLQEIATSLIASASVKEFMSVLPNFVGQKTPMRAYLTMMCIRLLELKRVLKDTGSLYLHCDPTASHYLKLLMDAVFGQENFRSEIIWRRKSSHNKLTRQYGPIHDTILFYSKSDVFKFHPGYLHYTKAYIEDRFKYNDARGRYQTNYLTGPGTRKGDSGRSWRGFDPTTVGRHWAIPNSLRIFLLGNGTGMSSQEQLEALYKQDLILFPKVEGGQPMYKQYLGLGVPYQDVWAYQPNTKGILFGSDECIDEDVKYLEAEDEKLGYPTQKPEGLLGRMIITSSDEGDVVLDPFCGCGTAVVAAQKLNRKWIGIDITYLAIGLMEWRLKNMVPMPAYKVIGEPEDLASAVELANKDKYQFQWWAVTRIGGQPYGDKKKGADTGIDGYLYYMDEKDKIKKAIISVKGGKNINVSMIRDLGHVIDREKSDIGVFILLEKPTRPMLEEAAMKGFYHSPLGKDYPRIQILTIEEIFQGKSPDIPPWIAPITKPPSVKKAEGNAIKML